MSEADTHSAETVISLNRSIVEAEMRSTAAADALAALMKTDLDTSKAKQHLDEAMDALLILRQQLAGILFPPSA